uniref:DOMON domain-containing protein n=1 Tax=Syphacia muris TaxID=451379 RepID=A0A0N5AEX1_9BILA
MSYRRTGIVYSLDEEGSARIIFDDDKKSFQCVFMSDDGDFVTLFGKSVTDTGATDTPSTSTMNVYVEDSETEAKFKADDVLVEFYKNPNPIGTYPYVSLKSESINFATVAVFHGMRSQILFLSTFVRRLCFKCHRRAAEENNEFPKSLDEAALRYT